ncbi:FMN reductase [Actinomadura madurae]|uniref:FMN reductase n=1 Tax=Actinomadura madurae TaxID=1993 RepID=A0A1I5PPF8_9ACTN|nr:NAD(P)H-dependent oxidoreductase [Actinomadura madurae]SFP35777.1 FMN reductase [Actinomadura madurae]
MTEIAVVVGNPKPRSRTFLVAEAVADRVAEHLCGHRKITIDLIDHADRIFRWPDDGMNELAEAVRTSDIVVVASPTYKASYTGLLKSFLDRYASNSLLGVRTIPILTASAPEHALAVEFALRPLLVELGASVPTRGLYFPMSSMPRFDATIDAWIQENVGALQGRALSATKKAVTK